MINITKQGNNVIVTSDNPNSFHIGNGELSVPLNTIYYVLDDESDFIQFNSTEKGKILFNGTIGDIQVNGNIVNRENILMELDNVFNSAATGGEGGTAGVLAINGYDGYINLKSINGQSLIGSGNITIEGGEGGTAGVNKIIMGEEDYGWNTYSGDVKLSNGWADWDNDGVANSYDIRIGNNEGSSLWFGFESKDNSIKCEDNGSRLSFTVNEDNFKTINGESIFGSGDITIQGGGGSSEEIPTVQTGDTGTSSNYIYSDATTKNGVVAFISNQRGGDGNGTYCGITYSYWNDVASNRFVKLDWTGTQAEYDALGEYSDYITYNIIEDEE